MFKNELIMNLANGGKFGEGSGTHSKVLQLNG